MNADGSDQRQVTSSPDEDVDPTWTADGRGITFLRYSQSDGGYYDVSEGAWTVDVATTVLTPVVGVPRVGRYRLGRVADMAWSPQGRYLALARDFYGTFRGCKKGLSIIDTATGRVRSIRVYSTSFNGVLGTVAWSPNGKKLVLQAQVSAGPHDYRFRFLSLATVNVANGRFSEVRLSRFKQRIGFLGASWHPARTTSCVLPWTYVRYAWRLS